MEILMGERIEAAAIRMGDFIHTAPPPKRHADIFRENGTIINGIVTSSILAGEQGFVTDTGRFVDRAEAWKIAKAAAQIKQPRGFMKMGPTLYTEDLW